MNPLRKDLSRRSFLVTSVAVAGAVTLRAAEPHLDFPTKPRDRLAVTSWPFRAYMEAPGNHDRDRNKPGMDAKDFAAMAVEHHDESGHHDDDEAGAEPGHHQGTAQAH